MQQPAPSEVNSPARKVQGMINLMEAAGHVRHQDWSSRGPTQMIMPLRVRRTSARVAWQRRTARVSPRLEAGPSGEMKFVNRERLSHFQVQKPYVRFGSKAVIRAKVEVCRERGLVAVTSHLRQRLLGRQLLSQCRITEPRTRESVCIKLIASCGGRAAITCVGVSL